tara:strand:+ start:182559 stop:183323 length:765 start_codon:yes stop_codon:yes gene_type:complete
MKRLILAATALLVLGICSVGALLAAGYRQSHQLQTPVFKAIADEDVDGFLNLCDPSVRQEIDPPMLATWMHALNDSLGECRFQPAGAFSVNFEKQPNRTIVKTKGGMQFANGIAQSDLVFLNGKIVSFSIDSDALARDWFHGPADTTFYRENGEVVIGTLLKRRLDELKPMMHPSLLEAADDDTLKHICDLGDAWAGNVTSIAATGADFQQGENQQLVVSLNVAGEKGNVDATVTYTFDGLKGHLTAFNIQPSE